jgi:hypothetical protein
MKIDKNGNEKVIKENYIVDNVETFADAELALFEEFKSLNAIDIIAIKRSRLKEIANKRTKDDENVYVAEIADKQINDNDEEVELIYKVALFAMFIDDAYAFAKEYLSQGYDMHLVGLRKTRIKDVLG